MLHDIDKSFKLNSQNVLKTNKAIKPIELNLILIVLLLYQDFNREHVGST